MASCDDRERSEGSSSEQRSDAKRHVAIYILKLENDKYYVGKSSNVNERIEAHKNGNGSSWTKKHKYVSTFLVVEGIPVEQAGFYEDMWTKQAMSHFGIDNVRGGAYVFDTLYSNVFANIQREIISALDRCHKCGGEHFAGSCWRPYSTTLWTCERCHGYTHTRGGCYRWRCEDCGDDCSGGDCPAEIARYGLHTMMDDDSESQCHVCGGDCAGPRCYEEEEAWAAMMASVVDDDSDDDPLPVEYDVPELYACDWCPGPHMTAEDAKYCDEAPCCKGCGIPVHSHCECMFR